MTHAPILGEAFDPEQMNLGETFDAIAAELDWYLPDHSKHIQRDLDMASNAYSRAGTDDENESDSDLFEIGDDAITEAEDMLTEFAQSVEKHDYIYFTVDGPFAGFRINVDSAIEDADWKYESNGSTDTGNPHQPGDGAGLEVFVNDHGNVTAWIYKRNGHKRELFSVV